MAVFRAQKVVSALPGTLGPDTIYCVRVGTGFDLYVSDSTGATAHKVNQIDLTPYTTSAALSGTTPSVDVSARDVYTLTTEGNTTFTLANAPAAGTVGSFTLILTSGGTHTLTWPVAVKWAGGTAPDAPASGETNVYTFATVDAGTTWFGFLAGAAMA